MTAHVSDFTGRLRGATKRHALLYIELHRINTVDALFHVIRYCGKPHSIGKMKRQKLLKEVDVYESEHKSVKLEETK